MNLVHKENDGRRTRLYFLDDFFQTLLEFTFHARPGLESGDVQFEQAYILQRRRNIARNDLVGETFGHCGLAHARFAGEDGVVLATAHENIDDLTGLLVPPDDGIDFSGSRLFGQILAELLEGLFLAHLGRGHRAAGLTGYGTAPDLEAVSGAQLFLDGAAHDFVELFRERIELDLFELLADVEQFVAKAPGLEDADDQMPRAHLRFAKHQRSKDPAPFHGFFDVGGEIGYGSRASGEAIESFGQVGDQS